MSNNTHIVKHGDTLWKISKSRYGDPQFWTLIAQHNKLPNADRILVGQVLKLPPKHAHKQQQPTSPSKFEISTPAFTPPAPNLWNSPTQTSTGIAGDTLHWIDDKPVLCPRLYPTRHALEPALDVEYPVLSIKLNGELFKMRSFLPLGVLYIEATLSITGEGELQKKGNCNITLTKDSIEINNGKITKEGVEAVFNFQGSNWKTGLTLKNGLPKLSLTHVPTNTTLEFDMKVAQDHMVTFESKSGKIEIKEGDYTFGGQVSIKLGLNIIRTKFLEELAKGVWRVVQRSADALHRALVWTGNAIVQVAPVVGTGILVVGGTIFLGTAVVTAPVSVLAFAGALTVLGLGYMLDKHKTYNLSAISI